MLSRLLAIFPLVLTLVAFVLSFLVLFAGHKQDFMEDYAIARLNTSMIGHNLVKSDSSKDASTNKNDKSDDLLDKIADKWDDVKDGVKDGINNITGSVADKLADELGISEWYSIHVLDSCQGKYKPNATVSSAGLNVTNCTGSSVDERFNLTKILDKELGVGPLKLNLNDLNWPDDIQDGIDALNKVLLGIVIVYAVAIGFSGLAMIGALCYIIFDRPAVAAVNFICSLLAALSMTIGSIAATVASSKGVEMVNKKGKDIGLSGSVGTKFIIITWIAAGFMIAATGYWAVQFCADRRKKTRTSYTEKSRARTSDESHATR